MIQKACHSLASYQWLLYICPHLMVTCAYACHVLSNVYTPFLALPYFWPKNSCHDYGVTIYIYPIAELIKMVFLATLAVCEVVSQFMNVVL